MKIIICFVCLLSLYGSVRLFSEEGQSYSEWGIEEYKRAIITSDRFSICDFEEFAAYETGEKYFLCKYNAEGDRYKTKYISLYAFNKNNEFQEYNLGYARDAESEAIDIIMSGIPGNHLWNTVICIGDFNGDGLDEIASIHFGGAYNSFEVIGIDPYSKEVIVFFDTEFWVDLPPTYCPVEFVKYKGINGFRVVKGDGMINWQSRRQVEFKYPIEGSNNLTWFFYKWDEKEREYVEVEEVNPQYMGDISTEMIQEQNNSDTTLENKNPQSDIDTEKSSLPLWAWIAIAGGVVAVAGVVFFVVRKKGG